MIEMIEMIGMMAALCTTIAFLPQAIKTWQTKSTKDISLVMYSIFCLGLLLWLIYGILINSIPLISANVITFFFAVYVLIMKLIWK